MDTPSPNHRWVQDTNGSRVLMDLKALYDYADIVTHKRPGITVKYLTLKVLLRLIKETNRAP